MSDLATASAPTAAPPPAGVARGPIVFHPARYTEPELRFLREKATLPPVAVFAEPLPKGVSGVSVRPVLQAIYELEELAKHQGTPWAGRSAFQACIDTYLEERIRDAANVQRGAPKFSGLHQWDARGRAFRGGVGADSHRLQTYLDLEGIRRPFALDLAASPGHQAYTPDWLQPQAPLPDDFEVDDDQGNIRCPLCGAGESFNPASQQSKKMARVRMLKHLKQEREKDPVRHREFYRHIAG